MSNVQVILVIATDVKATYSGNYFKVGVGMLLGEGKRSYGLL